MRLFNWICRRFFTRVRPGRYNRFQGRIVTEEEWKGWDDALVWGWHAERLVWGGTIGAYGATPEEACARLDAMDAG